MIPVDKLIWKSTGIRGLSYRGPSNNVLTCTWKQNFDAFLHIEDIDGFSPIEYLKDMKALSLPTLSLNVNNKSFSIKNLYPAAPAAYSWIIPHKETYVLLITKSRVLRELINVNYNYNNQSRLPFMMTCIDSKWMCLNGK